MVGTYGNAMAMREIWDKFPEVILQNYQISRAEGEGNLIL